MSVHKFNNIKTIDDFISQAEKLFDQNYLFFGHGTDNAWDEAAWICMHVLAMSYDEIVNNLNKKLSNHEIESLVDIANKRIKTKKPLAYLLKEAWFCNEKYYVDENVIVPRSPIAELINNRFKPWLKNEPKRILDLCTGSACIAIACSKVFNNSIVDAVDISDKALDVAKKNLELHNVAERVNLIKSDLFKNIGAGIKYDLIVSNPPYVPTDELEEVPKEYTYEPRIALESGKDGLECVRKILFNSGKYMNENGILIVELGYNWPALQNAYPEVPFSWLDFEHGGEGIFCLEYNDLIKHFK